LALAAPAVRAQVLKAATVTTLYFLRLELPHLAAAAQALMLHQATKMV
jgi:hypothetical protein